MFPSPILTLCVTGFFLDSHISNLIRLYYKVPKNGHSTRVILYLNLLFVIMYCSLPNVEVQRLTCH